MLSQFWSYLMLRNSFYHRLNRACVNKHKFNLALTLAYIINAFIKIVFSFLAFLSFGSNTDQVILNNLPEGTIRTCSNLLFVSSCIFSYALCVFPMLVFIQTTEIYEHAVSKFPKVGSFCHSRNRGSFYHCWWRLYSQNLLMVVSFGRKFE